jgi:hypothetical protein
MFTGQRHPTARALGSAAGSSLRVVPALLKLPDVHIEKILTGILPNISAGATKIA